MAKTYESYKDSGIAWIGEIPSEWKVGLVGRYFNEIKNPNINQEEKNTLQFKMGDIISKKRGDSKYNPETIEAYNVVEPGTIMINGLNLSFDFISQRVGQVHEKGAITSTYLALYPSNGMMSDYAKYLLKAYDNCKALHAMGRGLRATLSYGIFRSEPILIPSIDEQHSIASFLDTKCGEIDSLISLQEEMISELQAYKQSVITETVTKGLDPNAKMNCCASREKNDACISSSETQPAIERKFKDSGVEWIGEIPEGWEVLALKRIFKIIAGATPKSENEAYWDGDIAWITPADYKTEQKYVSFGRRNLSEQGYHACSTVLLPKGSIVFSKRAPIGLVAITERELCTNQGCLGCVPIRDVSNVFMYYLLSVYTEQFELYGSGTTFKEISANNFANFKLMLPPLSEQQAIASYLDVKTSQIDSLISLKQQKIDELKDYKKSIIYEYVTGKKRV